MASFLKASCASKRTKTAHEHFEALLGSTEDDRAAAAAARAGPDSLTVVLVDDDGAETPARARLRCDLARETVELLKLKVHGTPALGAGL